MIITSAWVGPHGSDTHRLVDSVLRSGGDLSICASVSNHQFAPSRSATAVTKNSNARIAAQVRIVLSVPICRRAPSTRAAVRRVAIRARRR